MGAMKHLRAGGGLVRLEQTKKSGEKVLGGVVLECRRFDHDPNAGVFVATGPGKLIVNNSMLPPSGSDPNRVSLRQRCYVFLQNFDTLKYFADSNQVVAEASTDGALLIDYFPVRKDGSTRHILMTATHVEVELAKGADGQTELSTLTASRGITYKDLSGKNEFFGSRLFYDHSTGIVKVTGDENQPCNLNGQLVDSIEYDMNAGTVKAKVVGPGSLQSGPGAGLERLQRGKK